MKKFICGLVMTVLSAVVMLLAVPGEAGAFAGGEGSLENPYQIETAEQLATVAEAVYLDQHFILAADVGLSDTVWGATYAQAHSTGGWEPIGASYDPFTGSFDGDGHTITGLYINRANTDYVGLFGYTNDATIQNVELVEVNVTGYDSVGGLIGQNQGTIKGCYVAGDVIGNQDIGGLAGSNCLGDIEDSYAVGAVNGNMYVGGLVGCNYSNGIITSSYATGAVDGEDFVGGLVGLNYEMITDSYAAGVVTSTGDNIGGLVGSSGVLGTVTQSYYDSETTGQSDTGKGEPKTTVQMQTPITFTDWDFAAVWGINPAQNGGYPFLGWQTEYTDAQFAGGTGDAGTPYQVSTPWQLNNIRAYLDKHFILAADVDLSDTVWGATYAQAHSTGGWEPIGTSDPFTGSFDGDGHTITGLFINRPTTDDVGLFGYTDGATIQSVGLLNVDVAGDTCVGGLVGFNSSTTITDSYATGQVAGNADAGGLVGENSDGTITDSYATGDVGGANCVGGLVGYNYSNGTITNSYATGAVDGKDSVGGLVGLNTEKITDSYAAGAVTGTGNNIGGLVGVSAGTIENSHATGNVNSNGGYHVGGLAGENQGTVNGCYATGDAIGYECVGGLVGANFSGVIEDSYAVGAVSGNKYVGGLVGVNNGGMVTASFWDTQTSGQQGSSGGTGKTTAEMKQRDTFTGWDFTNTWTIATGTYPYLNWQNDNCDFAPPVFTAGYPQADNINHNALNLLVEVDEDATAYYVVLADGADAPTAVQVKAGADADNNLLAAECRGSIELTAAFEEVAVITGLNPETAYDIYVTAKDTAGNLQPDVLVAKVEVTTFSVSQYITVTDTNPADGATDVSRTPTITVTFSDNIQADTNLAYITLKDSGNSTVNINKSISGKVLTITPDGNLAYCTTYTVAVPADAVKSAGAEANLAEQYQFSFTTRSAPTGGGGGSGGSATPEPATTETSKDISAATGGTVSLGDVSVHIPAGTLPGDATFSISKLTPSEVDEIVPEGLRLKLAGDIYVITTTGARDFGDNTITIKIPYDPNKIATGDSPVINYYDEETGEWTPLQTAIEQGADGKWYAVVQVNHLTIFGVFSTAVPDPVQPQKVIKLTIGSTEAFIDGQPYTLDAAPFVDARADRTLVPIRFVSEALDAEVEWLAETRQVNITDAGKEITLTIGSTSVLVNGQETIIDSAPSTLPPGRTFVPLRFVSETLGARVVYDNHIKQISIVR